MIYAMVYWATSPLPYTYSISLPFLEPFLPFHLIHHNQVDPAIYITIAIPDSISLTITTYIIAMLQYQNSTPMKTKNKPMISISFLPPPKPPAKGSGKRTNKTTCQRKWKKEPSKTTYQGRCKLEPSKTTKEEEEGHYQKQKSHFNLICTYLKKQRMKEKVLKRLLCVTLHNSCLYTRYMCWKSNFGY